MKSNQTASPVRQLLGAWRVALVIAAAALLSACGGGGEVVVDPPKSAVSVIAPRALDPEFLARKAVSYSPFRTAMNVADRDTEVITSIMVKQDLDLLVLGNFKLIRLFDSSDKVAKLVLEVIRDNNLDIKVMLGAYMQGDAFATAAAKPGIAAYNQAEMARCVALANNFRSIVLAVSVGNETMVSWSFNPINPLVMGTYLATVRSQITQPVTTDDNWALYADPPKAVTDNIDFVAMHTYPELDSVFNPVLWDWKQLGVSTALGVDGVPQRATAMMNAAIARAQYEYQAVRDAFDRKGLSSMPIVIGETGWNAVNVGVLSFRAHPVNQKMYFNALANWRQTARTTGAGPANIFYFEAFDEPWKGGDDKWGLFNVSRQARLVIQNLNPPSVDWVYEPGAFTGADALFFKPLVPNPVIAANRYTVFGDAVVPGAVNVFPTLSIKTFARNNGIGVTAAVPLTVGAAEPADGGTGIEISPTPETYGWGVVVNLANTALAEDMSNFSGGTLNFSIKTLYPGKIEIGFSTGSKATTDLFDVIMPLSPGQFGYLNDGQWHQVSIPISALIPFGAKGFGDDLKNSPDAVLDLSKVTIPFLIADRYDRTGKDQSSGITTKLNVDAIFWTKP